MLICEVKGDFENPFVLVKKTGFCVSHNVWEINLYVSLCKLHFIGRIFLIPIHRLNLDASSATGCAQIKFKIIISV